MTAGPGLVKDLQKRVTLLEADLRRQSDDPTNEWGASLRQEHQRATLRGRTGLSWSEWREGEVSQAAVSWVLATVFIRFCEDNRLLDNVWIAGPDDRLAHAVDAETAFYTEVPSRTATDWLRESFSVLAALPAGRGLVDPRHNPVWSAAIGPDAAHELVTFWRSQDDAGVLVRDFSDPSLDTRFLGDLYQDLSESARKKYALLQTPVFVEEFILDRTLTPALEEFGLEGLSLIDPTCGSGHFLLGAFDRLLDAWAAHAPNLTPEARVQKALDSVNGVDLNPFAVAVSRFRLTVAALTASGIADLAQAPAFAYHLAVGDSLLAGTAGRQGELFDGLETSDESLASFEYAAEDVSEHPGILDPGRYHVVVGNPPYITVKDPGLNEAYRLVYPSVCHREYSLSAPFADAFFRLAILGTSSRAAGFVGQITSNSFMKREFGTKLIENLLSGRSLENPVDLTHVIDTSGAFIPGHGTPTVIMFGRRQVPHRASVRVVLGNRSEPSAPIDPATGLVWTEMLEHEDDPGFTGEFVAVADWPRSRLTVAPWIFSASGYELVERMGWIPGGSADRPLSSRAKAFGYTGQTNADPAFVATREQFARKGVLTPWARQFVDGESVRNFRISDGDFAVFPYADGSLVPIEQMPAVERWLWPLRSVTWARRTFAKRSYRAEGRTWWEWHQVSVDRLSQVVALVYPNVETHNHFVLDTRGRALNPHAPAVYLPVNEQETNRYELLAVLNSSTAAFWLKQVSHNKGRPGADSAAADEPWEQRYEYTGAKLKEFPLPPSLSGKRSRQLTELAWQRDDCEPGAALKRFGVSRDSLDTARDEWDRIRREMIFHQEEMDWEIYVAYGLVDGDLLWHRDEAIGLDAAERTFAIRLARNLAAYPGSTTWFTHHNHQHQPCVSVPEAWPDEYRALIERRLTAVDDGGFVGLLERPEFKRRWTSTSWDELERTALSDYVLDRLEDPSMWSPSGAPGITSVGRLADRVRQASDLVAALRLLSGQQDVDVTAELEKLLREECVPFLAAYRYADTGLVKCADWEQVWALQRREDAGEKVTIPVPPKYTNKDFRRASYWSARGKLDVPKERFISYPGAERGGDKTLVLGWAGWDHLEQARALATLITEGIQEDGWDGDRVRPLLAGLAELEPWLHQWHDAPDPLFGGSPAEFMTTFLEGQLDALSLTREALASWRVAPTGKAAKAAAKAADETTDQELDL